MLNPPSISRSAFINLLREDFPIHIRIQYDNSVVLGDSDVDISGVRISTYMNSNEDLTIGSTAMTEIVIPIVRNASNSSIIDNIRWNNKFIFKIGVENTIGIIYWVTVGEFKGVRPEQMVGTDIINFIAYDNMQDFEVLADEFLDSMNTAVSLIQFTESLCNYCGNNVRINYDHPDIPYFPGDMLVNTALKQVKGSTFNRGITCRELLGIIAEATGCYAVIDANGDVDFRWFKDYRTDYTAQDSDVYESNAFKPFSGKTWKDLEDYTWEDLEDFRWIDFEDSFNMLKINGLKVQKGENDLGVYYPGDINGNIYTILNNPILTISSDEDIQKYLKPLYERLSSLPDYLPTEATCVGNPLVEVGDIIAVSIDNYVYTVPVFNIVRTFNGSLVDTYEVTGQLNREVQSISSSGERMDADGYYHKYTNNYKEFSSYFSTDDGTKSDFLQTDQEIKFAVSYLSDYSKFEMYSHGMFINSNNAFEINTKTFNVNSGVISLISNITLGHDMITSVGKNALTFTLPNNQDENKYHSVIYVGVDDNYISHEIAEQTVFVKFVDYYQNPSINIEMSKEYDDGGDGSNHYTGLQIEMLDETVQGIEHNFIVKHSFPGKVCGYIGDYSCVWKEADIKTIYSTDVYATEFHTQSSREVKHDIVPLQENGQIIDKLKPVSFVYNDDENNKTRFGLIYEDTVDEMPNICQDNGRQKSINYIDLIPVLLKEIQTLRKRVSELENN